jgi:CBS domain-containing protein
MHDIAEFLHRHPPFEELDEEALDELAETVEVEYFPAGTTIFRQGEEPRQHARIVRRGAVELIDRGRVLDVLGEGELFGHPSMLSGLPTGFEARAGEDTLCYRLPAGKVVPLLTRPAGLRFVARSLLARPKPGAEPPPEGLDLARQPVARLALRQPVVCEPRRTVREVARRMAQEGASSALISVPEGQFGILTDHDLRVRVVADGMPVHARVSEAMSFPAFSVGPERLAADVMLEMLDRGIRHVPVISSRGEVLGMLDDAGLLANEARTPFALRRAIDDAGDAAELKRAAGRLRPAIVSLHDADVSPAQIAAIISVVADALTRRLIELTASELGVPPRPLNWLALGSLGRREAVPSSDVDSALVWEGEDEDEGQRRYMRELGRRVAGGLAAGGFAADTHGATAAEPPFAHSSEAWRAAIRDAVERPRSKEGLILISLLLDSRPVYGARNTRDVVEELRAASRRRAVLRLMLRLALKHRPPTGFQRLRDPPRDLVVEHSGDHRGQLDIKRGGLLPIVDIARYAGLAAATDTTSTPERLQAAGSAGVLNPEAAKTLEEAHDLFWRLRIEHQAEQLRRGAEPDDYVDPGALNPLSRRYLRDAFHAVGGVQRALSNELRFG